jgi:acetyltransferase-like isoleucine patch superfamily enzyme
MAVMNPRNRIQYLFGTYSYITNMGSCLADWLPIPIRHVIFARLFASYGRGVYIDYRCYFRYFGRIRLGNDVTINRGCRFFASHAFSDVEIRIGDNVAIAPEVCFFAAGHDYGRLELPDTAKSIIVGDNVWIGGRAILLPGVTIGEGAIVGAGSVVSKDIPAWTIAAGNPARVIKLRTVPAD